MQHEPTYAVQELLTELNIDAAFQSSVLSQVFTSFNVSAEDSIELIGTSIALYENYLQRNASKRLPLTPRQVYEDMYYGISEERQVPFPKIFRVSPEVRHHLCHIFDCGQEGIVKQIDAFIKDIGRQASKTKRKPSAFNWQRKFVDFFLTKIDLAISDSRPIQPEQVNDIDALRKIGIVANQRARAASLPASPTFPEKWTPSARVFAFLRSCGLDGKYVGNPGMIASFKLECRERGIPRFRADYEYVLFLERNSEFLSKLIK